jgi:hypothetical protein
MEYGTREELMLALQAQIEKSKKPLEIEEAIRAYWDHADNVAARTQLVTDKDAYNSFMCRLSEFAIRNDRALAMLERSACINPIAANHLKSALAIRLQMSKLTPDTIKFAIRALTDKYSKGRQGRLTSGKAFHTNLQLAQAVFALRIGTDGAYKFTASGVSSKNAFEVVAYATGIEFERVKKAWHSDKVLQCRLKEGKK